MGPNGTGGLLSEPDYRDLVASTAAIPVPITLPAAFASQMAPPMNQMQIPACVSHSVVDLLKLYWFKKLGRWIDFSPRFLDILSAEPDIPLDGGRRPRTVLKVAANLGCATNATLLNNTTLSIPNYRNRSFINSAALQEALQYRIPGYIRIPIEYVATRQAIFNFGAISTLMSIGNEMWLPSWSKTDIDPLRTPKQIVSGHQMSPFGWDGMQFNKIQNEWSSAWADGGRNLYNPVQWNPFIHEQWAIASIPDDTTLFLQSLPAPKDFHYVWNKNLHFGEFNEDVKFAQIFLMIFGFLKTVNPEELGTYGPKTAAAVMAFQSSRHISPIAPNNIGPLTRSAMNMLVSIG